MTRAQHVNVEYHKSVAQLQSSEARLDEAAANLNRVQVLDEEGQVLRQRVEQLRAKLNVKKSTFAIALSKVGLKVLSIKFLLM